MTHGMRDFWSTQPTMAPMMPAEEKAALADSGRTFDVVAIKEATSVEYGDFWAVEISVDGMRSVIAMGMNETRDAQVAQMQDWFTAGNGGIPCTLVSFRTKSGFTAYGLQPPGATAPRYQPVLDDREPPF